jgi:hypothetical protein
MLNEDQEKGYRVGDRVKGRYTGQHPYSATVIAIAGSTQHYQLVMVQLDDPISLPGQRVRRRLTAEASTLEKA